jgi:hypothetical protein
VCQKYDEVIVGSGLQCYRGYLEGSVDIAEVGWRSRATRLDVRYICSEELYCADFRRVHDAILSRVPPDA